MRNVAHLLCLCVVVSSCAAGTRSLTIHETRSEPQPRLVAYLPPNGDLNPNDMATGPTAVVPVPVEKRLRRIAEEAMRGWRQFCGSGADCAPSLEAFLGPVVHIPGPPPLSLYVFERTSPEPGNAFYYFVVFDPRTGAATPNPPSIFAKWMEVGPDGLLKHPIVTFTDFDHDGRLELAVEEVVHNGNVYNAVMYHYYAIEPNLSLRHALAIEANYVCLDFQAPGGVIKRTVRALSPTEIELTAILEREGAPQERVGVARLTRPDSDSPFRVRSRKVLVEKFRGLLISGSGDISDNQLLRDGYRMYY